MNFDLSGRENYIKTYYKKNVFQNFALSMFEIHSFLYKGDIQNLYKKFLYNTFFFITVYVFQNFTLSMFEIHKPLY